MPLPKSPKDFRLQVSCGMCRGSGGYGMPRQTCEGCRGEGWQAGDLSMLDATQLQKFRVIIPATPLDPELPYPESDPMDNLSKLLTGRTIHTVSFPGKDATRIDLISKDGITLRLFLEKTDGHFTHFNAVPLADPTLPS
ncbi:MAG: hypothetical protein EOP85_07135 [Verrucomicrobiaceae bacterium]|nr:MAG: hypothetical protein EOP85_07135 [Verrucomicrobiaceae bacterium]